MIIVFKHQKVWSALTKGNFVSHKGTLWWTVCYTGDRTALGLGLLLDKS